MKDLEKIFYGNIVAYVTAMLPEATLGDLSNVVWMLVLIQFQSSTLLCFHLLRTGTFNQSVLHFSLFLDDASVHLHSDSVYFL